MTGASITAFLLLCNWGACMLRIQADNAERGGMVTPPASFPCLPSCLPAHLPASSPAHPTCSSRTCGSQCPCSALGPLLGMAQGGRCMKGGISACTYNYMGMQPCDWFANSRTAETGKPARGIKLADAGCDGAQTHQICSNKCVASAIPRSDPNVSLAQGLGVCAGC
jgi:hypothetical protein